MAEAVASAWVEILPDFKNFRNNLNGQIGSTFGAGGVAAGESFGGGFKSSVGAIFTGNLLADAAFGAGRLIAQGIGAGVQFGLQGVDLAAGLSEQVNAVQVSFGEFGDEILALSNTAPKRLNLTRVAFDQLAVRFSSFAKTIAGDGGNVSSVIDDLTQRGADFASVYDIEASQALELFQSGLAGETEPLRRFGLDLSAARIQTDALKFGIIDHNRELTEAEKIRTRYLSLLDQTGQVEGDLANTAGSYANQQRQFAVALEEAQTKFGEAILPLATDVLSWANTEFLPIIGPILADVAPVLTQAITDALPEIKDLLQSAGEVLPAAVKIGLDSLQGDAKFFSETLRVFQGELGDVLRENDPDVGGQVATFIDDRLAQYQANLDAFYEQIGYDNRTAAEKSADAWAEYGDRLGAYLAGSQNDFSDYNNAIQAGLQASADGAYLVGLEIPRGFARGVDHEKGAAVRAVQQMAAEVVGSMRTAMQIASPSKVFQELGRYTVEGFNLGIESVPVAEVSAPQIRANSPIPVEAFKDPYAFPTEIALLDADGSIMTHAKVIAASAVAQYAGEQDDALVGRVA